MRLDTGWRLAVILLASLGAYPAAQSAPLVLRGAIPLPKVEGRIDHLTFDSVHSRLFVAALGNNSVEVVDTAGGAFVTTIPGFHEPQGLAVVPDVNAVAVANGDSGTLQLIDADTYRIRSTLAIGGDADNVRYDTAAKRLYVAYEGGLAVVDPAANRVVQRIAIAGHPESFQLERRGSRIFTNLPDAGQVVIADRKTTSVLTRWPAAAPRANYPMAIDETAHRVFVGCRQPAAVVTYDMTTGKVVGTVPTVGDTDDLFYDASTNRLYVIGGEGYVDVFQPDDAHNDTLKRAAHIPTASGARTGLFVPDLNRLYVAVPHRGAQRAELRVYDAAR